MSNVTNVIVLAFGEDAMRPFVFDIATWDPAPALDRDWSGYFSNVAKGDASRLWSYDGKGPECDVWVGAFNHLNRPALLADLANAQWNAPESVQILIRGQDDDCWGLWMFVDGELREVALPGVTRLPLRAQVRFPHPVVDDADRSVEVGRLERLPALAPGEALRYGSVRLGTDGWIYSLHGVDGGADHGILTRAEFPDLSAAQREVEAIARNRGYEHAISWTLPGRLDLHEGASFKTPR